MRKVCVLQSGEIIKLLALVGIMVVFFLQAEDGIRDLVRSRGLGDVYKRQILPGAYLVIRQKTQIFGIQLTAAPMDIAELAVLYLSLIHI